MYSTPLLPWQDVDGLSDPEQLFFSRKVEAQLKRDSADKAGGQALAAMLANASPSIVSSWKESQAELMREVRGRVAVLHCLLCCCLNLSEYHLNHRPKPSR